MLRQCCHSGIIRKQDSLIDVNVVVPGRVFDRTAEAVIGDHGDVRAGPVEADLKRRSLATTRQATPAFEGIVHQVR